MFIVQSVLSDRKLFFSARGIEKYLLAVQNRGKVFSLIFDRGRIYLSTIKNYLNVAPKLGSKFDQNIFIKIGQK